MKQVKRFFLILLLSAASLLLFHCGETEPMEPGTQASTNSAPLAPAELSIEQSGDELTLAWLDRSSIESGFYLYYGLNAEKSLNTRLILPADSLSHTLTELQANKTYQLWLSAFNSSGESAVLNRFFTYQSPIEGPEQFIVSKSNELYLRLSWNPVSNASGYQVYLSNTVVQPVTPERLLGESATQVTLGPLEPQTFYTLWLEAFNEFSKSQAVSGGARTGGSEILPPRSPLSVSNKAISMDQINLYWTDRADNEEQYEIYINTEDRLPNDFPPAYVLDEDSELAEITGLYMATTYFFWIRSVNAGGKSATVESQSTTLGFSPEAPQNLQLSNSDNNHVTLTWTDPNEGQSRYKIYWNIENQKPPQAQMTTSFETSSTSSEYLSANTKYWFWLEAFNALGTSSDLEGQIRTAGGPKSPSDLVLTANGPTSFTATWESGGSSSGYYIYWSGSDEKPNTAQANVNSFSSSFTANNLLPGVNYTVWLESYNSIGSSPDISNAVQLPSEGIFYLIDDEYRVENGDFPPFVQNILDFNDVYWSTTNPRSGSRSIAWEMLSTNTEAVQWANLWINAGNNVSVDLTGMNTIHLSLRATSPVSFDLQIGQNDDGRILSKTPLYAGTTWSNYSLRLPDGNRSEDPNPTDFNWQGGGQSLSNIMRLIELNYSPGQGGNPDNVNTTVFIDEVYFSD